MNEEKYSITEKQIEKILSMFSVLMSVELFKTMMSEEKDIDLAQKMEACQKTAFYMAMKIIKNEEND